MSACLCKVEQTETVVTHASGSIERTVTTKREVNIECPEHGGDKLLAFKMPDLPHIEIKWGPRK